MYTEPLSCPNGYSVSIKKNVYLKGIKKLFHEYEIHSCNQADECGKMIPMQRFAFKKDSSKYSKNNKSYHFLNYFQLH